MGTYHVASNKLSSWIMGVIQN